MNVVSRLNVLLVSEDVVNQKVCSRILNRIGHRTITATNGVEALHIFALCNGGIL